MRTFRKLLVGIDVDADGALASGSRAAVDQALLLGRHQGAELTFIHVIDLPADQGQVFGLQPQSALTKRQRQLDVALERLVREAREQGMQASGRLLFGEDWRELIRTVHEQGHDLVLVGTRRRSIAGRALFGSTGNRLLRHCPCPVWCVKSDSQPLRAVLVADDLTDTGRAALALGALIAGQQQAPLHVLHVMELPEEQLFLGSVAAAELQQRQQQAMESVQSRIAALGDHQLSAVHISVGNGSAYAAILDHLRDHPVDLLCMGTVARSGLKGLTTGNTAENVLPWIECSLVAVKPEGFVSPVFQNAEHASASARSNAR